jgi:hypothetical protein
VDLGALKEARATADREAETVAVTIRQINELTTKIDRGRTRQREIGAQISSVETILAGFPDGLPVMAKTSADLLAEQQGMGERDRTRGAELAAAAVATSEALQAAKATLADLDRKAGQADARRVAAVKALDDATVTASLIGGVPCGGDTLYTALGQEPVDCSPCQFLTRAIAARDNLPTLEAETEAATSGAGEALAAASAASQAIAPLQAAAEAAATEVREFRDAAAMKAGALSHLIASTLEMERKIAGYNQALTRKGELAADLQAVVEALDRLELEIADLRASSDRRTEIMERATSLGVQVDATARSLEQAKIALTAAAKDLSTTAGSLEAARQRAADVANDKATVEALKVDIKIIEQRAAIAALYCEAVHRDGIPFILLEQFSIPMLQQATNNYLQRTNLAVQVESERELQSGDLRNSVEITFTDHRGRHPVSVASGAQRSSIGSALRHGMAELLARGTGSNIWLAVQDEGFGTLDPDNLEIAKTTLRNIAASRGTFMVISHVPGMSEVADHVLRVVDDGGTSRVEVA